MAALLKSFLIVIVPFVTVYSLLLFTLTLPPISDYEQDPITSLEKDVTAIIKVHKRADIAVRAAFSIYALYPSLAIVMVDDSPAPIDIKLPPNTQYFRIPENTGISYGRNFAVKKVETKYTLLMDDDWLLTNITYLDNAYEVLETNHSIGIVAGLLCLKEPMDSCYGYHGSLEIVEKKLTYKDNVIREDMGNGCQLVDLGENAMLARTQILRQYPWDERLKNAEHEDFYLSLKGHVNVASCPFFKILHKRPSLDAYAGYQYDRDLWGHQNILCKKWDLVGFNMMYTEWQRDCPKD